MIEDGIVVVMVVAVVSWLVEHPTGRHSDMDASIGTSVSDIGAGADISTSVGTSASGNGSSDVSICC